MPTTLMLKFVASSSSVSTMLMLQLHSEEQQHIEETDAQIF